MRSGKHDHVITLQSATNSVDAAGTPVFAWSDIATVRAEVLQSGTEEFIRTYGASDETVTVFRIRYLTGITNADRIIHGGADLNIKQVTEIQRRRGLELRTVAT